MLSSLWVPGRPIGNPQVVSFNLGRGVVPRGRPVAGQLSGTLLRAGLTNLESVCCFLVLDSVTSTNPVLGSLELEPLVHRDPPQSSGGLWMLYQSALGQVSM